MQRKVIYSKRTARGQEAISQHCIDVVPCAASPTWHKAPRYATGEIIGQSLFHSCQVPAESTTLRPIGARELLLRAVLSHHQEQHPRDSFFIAFAIFNRERQLWSHGMNPASHDSSHAFFLSFPIASFRLLDKFCFLCLFKRV